jgi:nicotinamidase-related amidase
MTTLDHSTQATHVAGSTPYSWPWNGDLNPAGTAAVVVYPLGSWPTAWQEEESAATSAAVVEVVEAVRAAGGTVIRVATAPPQYSPDAGLDGEFTVDEHFGVTAVGIDGFFGSSLDAVLRHKGIERLLLVGAGLETCIHSTMRSANDRGFECLLVVDACFAYDDAVTASSVSMIEMSGGIFGAVGTTAAVLDALAQARGATP